jgi:DNA-binding NarL/FixJ family response regulator
MPLRAGNAHSGFEPVEHGRNYQTFMNQISVLLAEDHLIVREGFRGLLKAERDIEIVGEAETGRQAVQLAKKLRPAVVVMDIAMPQLNGLEATRQILAENPSTKVIMLSAHADDAYVERASAAGAAGYLIKQASSHSLCEAIREVLKGNTFFSPSIGKRLNDQNAKSEKRNGLPKKRGTALSSREVEVLQLIAEGMANKQTAAELGISIKTVEKHRQRLMHKLNIHDTASLTRYAVSAGIIESSVQLTIV